MTLIGALKVFIEQSNKFVAFVNSWLEIVLSSTGIA
jgi:hypothetical protein